MTAPILQFDLVTKRFGGITALGDVSFEIQEGQCHALLGENGAGKSTLGKIIAGVHRADGGRLLLDGREVLFPTPLAAARAGISMVHQELAFCPNLSIAENLTLSDTPTRGRLIDWRLVHSRARTMLAAVGLDLDPSTLMSELSTAQEQMVQIALAVGKSARIIIMDEPTSSLSEGEAERLFAVIERLRADGVTIIYVSHRLAEIDRLCDAMTVLRDGRHICTVRKDQTSIPELVQKMIGRPMTEYFPQHMDRPVGKPLLQVEGLSAAGRFEDISFELRAGEVVGLAGLVGAGRSEIARAIFGIDSFDQGRVLRDGVPIRISSPIQAIRAGIGLLPEDRKRQALIFTMVCKENVSLAVLERLRVHGRLNHVAEDSMARGYIQELRIRAAQPGEPINGLSGGNQQKVALARWLATKCRVLILDEPTRGVDVGAKAEIHALIDHLAAVGHAILLISSDMTELINLSTRILVIADGRLVKELPRDLATQENIMRAMANVAAVA